MDEILSSLRKIMRDNGADAYLAFTSDYHMSEYICEHFKSVRYLSGFTGSNAALIVTMNDAALFTDGRYFLQAEKELLGSGITLIRTDETAALRQYLNEREPRVIAVDGRIISAKKAQRLSLPGARLLYEIDFLDKLWADRPKLPTAPVFVLEEKYSGKSAIEKLSELRRFMESEHVNVHVLTSIDDIAWLFNIRGGDVAFTPLTLSYAIIERDKATLFIDESKLNQEIRAALDSMNVIVAPYTQVYDRVKDFTANDRVLLSSEKVNYMLYQIIAERATVIDKDNPTTYAKCVKNEVERQNLKNAHVMDGVAMAKLLYRLKSHENICSLTETDAAQLTDTLRMEMDGCIYPSFSTISGYGENAAIVHYMPARGTDKNLEPRGFLLIDSGGQYYEGTTDVTRTIALGSLTDEQRCHYTLVLKGLIALSNCRFPHGCNGANLDAIARMPLWNAGLEYAHGTSHGIGYLSSVHEPPVNVRWYEKTSVTLEPGMLLSAEPGVYVEGSHGIRLENELLIKEAERGFLSFETLTLVPFDRDAIDISLLTEAERALINTYHKRVFNVISPSLSEKERKWLESATMEI